MIIEVDEQFLEDIKDTKGHRGVNLRSARLTAVKSLFRRAGISLDSYTNEAYIKLVNEALNINSKKAQSTK